MAEAVDEIHRQTEGVDVTIDLETTAGQGIDARPSVRASPSHSRPCERFPALGVCVDTCHIFAAGYSLDEPERYDER